MIFNIIGLLLYVFIIAGAALMFLKVAVIFLKGKCDCTARLDGKTVLITGGNAGVGFETAMRLAKHGARVVIASRNLAKSEAAAKAISEASNNPAVSAKALDLSSMTSIKHFVEDFNKTYDRLDILINNAGYSEYNQTFSKEGVELTMLVNHFGPAYLTHLLLGKLTASKPSRIIFVSSGLYKIHKFDPKDLIGRTPRYVLVRYGNSKLCNILSAIALSKILPEGVTANALHPGTTDSEIWEHIPVALLRKITYIVLKIVCRTVEECAQTSIHAALAPSLENVTGKFLEECKLTKLDKLPSQAETEAMARRVWDDTIRICEDVLQQEKDAHME